MVSCGNFEDLQHDPNGTFVGVDGPNPRFTASKGWGARLSSQVIAALVERVNAALSGKPVDNWADLRALVQRLQAGDLIVARDSGGVSKNGLCFELENVQSQSKVHHCRVFDDLGWHGNRFARFDISKSNCGRKSRAGGS